jgi:glycosyltransferase involved in cell wall biosynthesis
VRDKDLHEIKEKKLSDLIVTHKPVPYKTILQYLKGADILFLPSGASVGYALPYKFFDYLKVEKPVFASAPENSSVAMLMRNISCGLLCPPYDEELASKNLKQLISDQLVFDFAGKEAYTWEKLSERYADILTDKNPEII